MITCTKHNELMSLSYITVGLDSKYKYSFSPSKFVFCLIYDYHQVYNHIVEAALLKPLGQNLDKSLKQTCRTVMECGSRLHFEPKLFESVNCVLTMVEFCCE